MSESVDRPVKRSVERVSRPAPTNERTNERNGDLWGYPVSNLIDYSTRGRADLESWWTVEHVDKSHDGNDNEHGVVVFQHDLDYLLNLLYAVHPGHKEDPERHARASTSGLRAMRRHG